jgi:hypothetical protein
VGRTGSREGIEPKKNRDTLEKKIHGLKLRMQLRIQDSDVGSEEHLLLPLVTKKIIYNRKFQRKLKEIFIVVQAIRGLEPPPPRLPSSLYA